MSKLSRWIKRENIHVVFENDFEKLLKSLKIYEQFAAGKIQCGICGRQITSSNIQCIYPDKGEIKLCCTNPDCYRSTFEKIGK